MRDLSYSGPPWRRWFTGHPARVGESYRQHLFAACGIGLRLLLMGTACLCHALVPGLFEETASRGVSSLAEEIANRRRVARSSDPQRS